MIFLNVSIYRLWVAYNMVDNPFPRNVPFACIYVMYYVLCIMNYVHCNVLCTLYKHINIPFLKKIINLRECYSDQICILYQNYAR